VHASFILDDASHNARRAGKRKQDKGAGVLSLSSRLASTKNPKEVCRLAGRTKSSMPDRLIEDSWKHSLIC